ncbi:hypothetical protein D9619_012536 [Psilocybe cf. subviscida]|uniref:Uncharacterized protein n=1 Tax=Psilocybe cf. subviscida TaxID=2480587 RepID=A0A8H5B819_9AGAR|nr:hypothetical protein D9619_012536 [Psilocybe cf. subviscida]
MKSYSNDEDLFNDDAEALELENLLPDVPTRADRATRLPSGIGGLHIPTISRLRAVIWRVLHPSKTRMRHTPVVPQNRAVRAKYTPLPFHIHISIARLLRVRPRTLIFLTLCILIWTPIILLTLVLAYGGVPPDYSVVREWERELPQHIWSRSEIQGAPGRFERRSDRETTVDDGRRYLRFPDHLWGHGLNNVLQEALLTSHLAHRAHRSFVFEDFTWSHLPLPYTLYDFALRPTRVPLGAFLGGWVVGGGVSSISKSQSVPVEHGIRESGSTPMLKRGDASDAVNLSDGPGSTSSINLTTTSKPTSTEISSSARDAIEERRAISAEYFDYVCPPSRRVEIWYGRGFLDSISSQADANDVTSSDMSMRLPPGDEASGTEIVEWWIRRLQQPDVRDEPCVVVREDERRVFDSNFFGSTRILSLFDELKHSPVLRGFAWSPLVQHALDMTMSRFFGENTTFTRTSDPSQAVDTSSTSTSSPRIPLPPLGLVQQSSSHSTPTIPGLLAVHLRRGDYKRHCLRLADWRAGYMAFNRFDGMLDTFDAEGHLRGYENTTSTGTEQRFITMSDDNEESRRRRTLLLDERREAYYLAHCLPTIQEIVKRLHDVREEYQHSPKTERGQASSGHYALGDVYILTNGWPSFVEELRAALLADGWGHVMGTPQLENADAVDGPDALPAGGDADQSVLVAGRHARWNNTVVPPDVVASGLTREEKGVSVAVDMGFAERAEVFVGNGFSSLSSNIVMLRMARGMPVYSSRLL